MIRCLAMKPGWAVWCGSTLAVLAVTTLAAGSAAAQTAPAPGAIMQQTTPAPAEIEAPSAPIVLPERKSGETGSTVQIPVSKLTITGNHLIPTDELHALVASAEGKTLTIDQLNAIVHRITTAYHAAGYPVAYAFLPAQTVNGGVVRISVIEPSYDRIEVTGDSRFNAEQTRATLGVKPGEPVVEAPLARGLLLLQETPGLIVNGVLLPGATPGTTSLSITRKDTPLLSGQLSLTNNGSTYTGRELSQLSLAAADPFGWGSAFAANASISKNGDLASGGISATSPDLGGGLRFGAYGSWTRYVLGGTFAALDQHGWARQLGIDLTHPLVLAPGRRLDLRVDLVDNRLRQETRSIGTESRQHLGILRLALSGARSSADGGVTSGRVALNLGRLSLAPALARGVDAAGPRAAGAFTVLRFRLARQQPLPSGFTLTGVLSGQQSDRNLDSSQKFYLGGPYGVMSTDVGTNGGDNGLLARLRLSHPLKLGLPGDLSLAGLMQWGVVKVDHSPYTGGSSPNRLNGGGIGLGLRYALDRWSFQADAAAPLRGQELHAGTHIWLSGAVSF